MLNTRLLGLLDTSTTETKIVMKVTAADKFIFVNDSFRVVDNYILFLFTSHTRNLRSYFRGFLYLMTVEQISSIKLQNFHKSDHKYKPCLLTHCLFLWSRNGLHAVVDFLQLKGWARFTLTYNVNIFYLSSKRDRENLTDECLRERRNQFSILK